MKKYLGTFIVLVVLAVLMISCMPQSTQKASSELSNAIGDLGQSITKLATQKTIDSLHGKDGTISTDDAKQVIQKLTNLAIAYSKLAKEYSSQNLNADETAKLLADTIDIATRYALLETQITNSQIGNDQESANELANANKIMAAAAELLSKP